MTDNRQQPDISDLSHLSVDSPSPVDDESLARAIELRQYDDFRLLAVQALESSSWTELTSQIERIAEQSEAVMGWELPLREGVIRDALIDLLDLSIMNGLEGDLLDIFKALDAETIHDLREQAQDIAITKAEEQIRKGNTFFFDIGELSDTHYAVLVPDIVKSRNKQIKRIDKDSSFGEICSTYYGFTIVTTGGAKKDSGGASDESIEKLETLLGTTMNGRGQIRFSSNLFSRYAPYSRKLLWGMLRITIGGKHSQIAGAKELGEMGDSRATDILIERFKQTENKYISRAFAEALGSIGSARSFEVLCSKVHSEKRDGLDVIPSIGGVRNPLVFDFLKEALATLSWTSYEYVIEGMARSRDSRFVPALTDILSKSPRYYRQNRIDALKAVKLIGDIEAVNEWAEEALDSEEHMSEVIDILSTVSGIIWTHILIKVVAKGLANEHNGDVAKAVRKVPALLNDPSLAIWLQ